MKEGIILCSILGCLFGISAWVGVQMPVLLMLVLFSALLSTGLMLIRHYMGKDVDPDDSYESANP